MKYLPLIWSGLWRKPVRTIFTLLSVAAAFALFGSMHGAIQGIDAAIEQIDANRVRVQSNTSRGEPLPVAYASQIAEIPYVRSVTSLTFLGAYFREPRNGVGGIALGGDLQLERSTDFFVPLEQVEAFKNSRTGVLLGRKLANLYSWKVGDHIILNAPWTRTDGSKDWEFDVVGIFDVPKYSNLGYDLWLRYEYFDEARVKSKGLVNSFLVRTTDPEKNTEVATAIDQLFENSSNPTIAQSDRDWARAARNKILDIHLVVNVVLSASLFTLLFVTTNTMMQSTRQRTPEFAVLKTVGFTNKTVFRLVALEAIAIYVTGALLGLLVAAALFPVIGPRAGGEKMTLPLTVLIDGLLVALLAAAISAALPASRARNLTVVNALSRR